LPITITMSKKSKSTAMSKPRSIELKPLPPPRLEILNFIDILITLIAFFMMTSIFVENNRQFGVNLPQVRQGDPASAVSSRLVLEIGRNGRIYWNGRPVNRGGLRTLLGSQPGETVVVVKADRDCRYQLVVDLLDLARSAGLSRIALEARAAE